MKMKNTFHSHFAQDIQDYISLRGSIGYAEYSYDRPLHVFDGFCMTYFPDTTSITQELAEAWCTKKANEKMRTLQRRTVILKGFTKYLISIGKGAYLIPDGMIGKPEKFIPYLYSDHELRLFFDSADSLPIHSMAPNRELVIPVLFRLLYCCGPRPQEVRHLRRCDVNLIDGMLHIVDSKRNKDRIVVMAEELRCRCQRYDRLMQSRLANREFFFQHPTGGEYSAEWIQNQFFRCWSFAGITFNRDTGMYWRPIALALKEAGFFVNIVNAMLIHDFSDNSLCKVKTDKADPMKIANYALSFWAELRDYLPEQ